MDIEDTENRFNKVCGFLKSLGFKGEVLVKAGLVMVVAHDKFSSSLIRGSMKKINLRSDGQMIECRFTSVSVFAWVSSDVQLSRKEIRAQAEPLAA